jgi:hypothetical protein
MPYQPGKAKEATATIEIEFEGEPVGITYRTKLVRTATLNIFEADTQYQPAQLREALETLVVAWDVLDEDGQSLPATQDITRAFDFDFLMAVFNGIVSHALPGEDGGATSSTGSSAAATSARVQKSTR